MQRAVTAIYRSHAIANLVRDELEGLGIGAGHISIIPETETTTTPGTARDDVNDSFDRLHDLHLPEDDTRIYQQAIRNGDYVVSVNVDDDDSNLTRVQEIMRRPEDSYNLDELGNEYGNATYEPRRQPLDEGYDERHVGRRDPEQTSPYTRYYTREQALMPRGGI